MSKSKSRNNPDKQPIECGKFDDTNQYIKSVGANNCSIKQGVTNLRNNRWIDFCLIQTYQTTLLILSHLQKKFIKFNLLVTVTTKWNKILEQKMVNL